MKGSDFLSIAKESAGAFWNARDARERAILMGAASLLILLLIYAIFFGPALSGRARLQQDLPLLRQQSAELKAMAQQAVELNNAVVQQVEPITQENVAASLTNHGMKAQNLSVNDNLVRLQLNPVSFSGLLDWLDEQQRTARLTVVEANFVALAQPDMVNASVTLKQQRNDGKSD